MIVCMVMRDAKTIPRSERIAAIVVGLMLFGSTFLLSMGGVSLVILPLAAILVGGVIIPGFWRTLGGSALAGAIAGALVLGPGMRIAMRLVAIAEPTQSPEFSLEGTVFIVVFLGLFFGVPTGTTAMFLGRGFGWGRLGIAIFSAGSLLAMLFATPDIRTELLELGLGGAMNIPMFGLVGFAYGWVASAVFGHLKFAAIKEAQSLEVMA